MPAPDPLLVELLYSALRAPIGIAVRVSNFKTGNQKFYTARRALGDPALDVLQFRQNPEDPTEMWITKGRPKGRSTGDD